MNKELILVDINITEETAGILFALNRLNHVEVKGISLCFGETSLESSYRSISGLNELLGWEVPVALGADRPWRRDYQLPPGCLCGQVSFRSRSMACRLIPAKSVRYPGWMLQTFYTKN